MKDDEEFAALIAGAVLRAGGEEIQAEVLSDLVERSGVSASLEEKIAETRRAGRRAGDFGMEIAGALLVPVLVEAGRQLWAIYVKKLGEKVAGKLADVTITEVKGVARRIWSGEEELVSVDEFEALVRKAAVKEGLQPQQVDNLVAALRSERMSGELQDA